MTERHPADVATPRRIDAAPAEIQPEATSDPIYLHWNPVLAGGLVAASLSFVLLSFAAAVGLAVVSPSASWRDTSATLALLGGLWLLLTSFGSFALGGYLAGRLRLPWRAAPPEEVEFRDGIHGLLAWGVAIIIMAFLALTSAKTTPTRADLAAPNAATAEQLLAFELDRLFRSESRPVDPANDTELRAQAARIITAGLGRTGMSGDDRAYLIGQVEARTGLSRPDAEARVNAATTQSSEAVTRARRGAVILAFMIGASLMLGAAVAWLMAALGGQHRDRAVAPHFWRRWEIDRLFLVRPPAGR